MESVEFEPQGSSSVGHTSLNTKMGSFYEDGDAEGALTQRGASKTVVTKKSLARVSLMMSHIERCYAEETTTKE
jgi:hypothetical protein